MKTKTINLIIAILLISTSIATAQTQKTSENNKIETQDIEDLIGAWKGSLTYIDYNTNEPYTMPVELEIQSKRKNRKLILRYTYPNEPKANSKAKLTISKDRQFINGKPITSRSLTEDGSIQIVTEHSGKDGNENKNASIKNIYTIGMNTLDIRKEVLFEGLKEWKKRNEYNFTKKIVVT